MNVIQRIINFVKKLIMKTKYRKMYYRPGPIPTRLGADGKEADNASKRWTDEDTELMLSMVSSASSYEGTAEVLGRTRHAISARVYELKQKNKLKTSNLRTNK